MIDTTSSNKEGHPLQGKVAIVTGAGSGIGRAAAGALAAKGAIVVAADIDPGAARSCVHEIVTRGGSASASELNVAEEDHWRRMMDQVRRDHKRLDVLVNSAGMSITKPVETLTFQEWRKVMSVNLDGIFLGTKYAIEQMKQNGGGSIINLASVSGIRPSGGASAYCTSKAAIRMFTKTTAIECADARTGVRVNVISPGGVKTPMWEKEEFFRSLIAEHGSAERAFAVLTGDRPSQQFFSPEEIARTVLYLASDESSHLTGIEMVMDRGCTG